MREDSHVQGANKRCIEPIKRQNKIGCTVLTWRLPASKGLGWAQLNRGTTLVTKFGSKESLHLINVKSGLSESYGSLRMINLVTARVHNSNKISVWSKIFLNITLILINNLFIVFELNVIIKKIIINFEWSLSLNFVLR